jgi:hypothetical protein
MNLPVIDGSKTKCNKRKMQKSLKMKVVLARSISDKVGTSNFKTNENEKVNIDIMSQQMETRK